MSDREQKEKEILSQKYRAKGFQSLSLSEYESIKARKNKTKKFKAPPFIKLIAGTPFVIIFIFGLLFLPWIVFVIATGPYKHWKEREDSKSSYYNDSLTLKSKYSYAKN